MRILVYPIPKSVRTVYIHTASYVTTVLLTSLVGVNQYPPQEAPQSAQNQASHDVSNFVDGSGHIFSMYLEMATEEDKRMVESWKADADGILIFVRLSSHRVLYADSLVVL